MPSLSSARELQNRQNEAEDEDEVEGEGEVSKEPCLTKGQWNGLAILVSVVTAALICVVVLACDSGNCGRRKTSSGEQKSSARADSTLAYIDSITLTGRTLIYPSTSIAEERAVKWLIDNDDLNTIDSDERSLRQRYALATLWFQTEQGGPPLPLEGTWVSAIAECEWLNVTCSNGNVTSVVLRMDQLTGQIPSDLALLTDLTMLDLSFNRLAATIPSSIGEFLTALKHLDLSSNELAGAIPTSLGELSALTFLRLPNNSLTGTMPFCNRDNTRSFRVLEADCKELECPCCTNNCTR